MTTTAQVDRRRWPQGLGTGRLRRNVVTHTFYITQTAAETSKKEAPKTPKKAAGKALTTGKARTPGLIFGLPRALVLRVVRWPGWGSLLQLAAGPPPPHPPAMYQRPFLFIHMIPQKITLAVITVMVYGWRITLNKGDDAKMDEKTNPANHITGAAPALSGPSFDRECRARTKLNAGRPLTGFLSRVLTKNYYAFLHFWLLVCPMVLCCDWSSFGVPNVDGLQDPRNLCTLTMYALLVGVQAAGWQSAGFFCSWGDCRTLIASTFPMPGHCDCLSVL